jgi:phage terminase small subunit
VLEALTAKQEAFCQAMLTEGDASKAYRKVYRVSPNAKAATVHRSAHEVLQNPKVSARLAALRKPAVESVQMTLATHLQQLAELRDAALKDKKWGPAILAEMARGKASGFYITKVENVTDPLKIAMANMTPEKAQQMLDALDKVEVIQEKAKRASKQ